MATTLQEKPTLAPQFYGLVDLGQPRQLLDYLIDHPDTRIDSTALQAALQFPQHKDVALAAYSIGETAAALGLKRPWTEGQLGYLMNAETANLLARARSGNA
ncbi:MAG: hypothetical protein M9947_03685 [Thermomicrobiales bacterium]|nr:hypothetical protein [Thermomicrobiales bacterium]